MNNRPPAPPFSQQSRPRDINTVRSDALFVEAVIYQRQFFQNWESSKDMIRSFLTIPTRTKMFWKDPFVSGPYLAQKLLWDQGISPRRYHNGWWDLDILNISTNEWHLDPTNNEPEQ